MRPLLACIVLLASLSAAAAEYEDCILDRMPGVANDAAARAIAIDCRQKYPRPDGAAPTKRTGLFDYRSGAECAAKKARDTPSQLAGNMIFASCNALYEPENPFAKFHRSGN